MYKKEYLKLQMSITFLETDMIRTSGNDALAADDVWGTDQIWVDFN